MWLLFPLLLLLCALPAAFGASVADASFWVTNGPVYATATNQQTLYIGGDFRYVGPVTGAGAAVKLSDGSRESDMPKVEGVIHVAVADGSGGWYIGGQFTSVGGVARANIAHIRSSKAVDTTFNPGTNGVVYALALSGDFTTLYVGGDFTSAGGLSRRRLAAVTAATGNVTADFNPDLNGAVRALALSSNNGTLYAGGEFTAVNGATARNRLAAFAATSGAVVAGFDPDVNGPVRALALTSDDAVLYAGGGFTSVNGGTPRSRLAAFATGNGTASGFDPDGNGTVYALALSDDNATLYAGGDFTDLNAGTTRNRLAAITTATGTVVAGFNPDVNGTVRVLRLSANGLLLHTGGDFTSVNNSTTPATRFYTATFTAANGEVHSTIAPHAGDVVRALALSSTLLYVGGDFNSLGGKLRDRLAALTIADGTANDWNPGANAAVRTLALSRNSPTLYVGGDFTTIGGAARNRLAAIATPVVVNGVVTNNTNNATNWNPDADGSVYALQLTVDETSLYAGGAFTSFNATANVRNRIARFSVNSSTPDSWHPNADGAVYALALRDDGAVIFLGGDFTAFKAGTVVRQHMAAFNTADDSINVWEHYTDAAVRALALSSDGATLFAGGDFTAVSGQARRSLASIGTSPPVGTEWSAQTSGATANLLDIAASSSRLVAIGENGAILVSNEGINWETVPTGIGTAFNDIVFTGLNMFVTVGEGGFVITSQNGSSWLPRETGTQASLRGIVWGVGGAPDPILVAVGTGGTIITSKDGATWVARTSPTGVTLNDIAVSGVDPATGQGIGFVAVGDFGTIITSEDGETWSAESSGTTANLNGVVWSGSEFVAVGDNGTVLRRTNNDGDSWVPATSIQTTRTLRNVTWGGTKFVAVGEGGTIITSPDGLTWTDQVAITGEQLSGVEWGQTNFIAVGDNGTILLSEKNDQVNGWTPEANGPVRALVVSADDSRVFAGGDFSSAGTATRRRLAAIGAADNLASNWDPDLDGAVYALSFISDTGTLFAGGVFASVGNEARGGIAAFDLLPPVTTVSPDPGVDNIGYYKEAQTITLTCADGDGSGCDAIYASIDGTDPPISEVNRYTGAVSISTNTTLRFRAVDSVGNSEEIQSREYVIDVAPPETKAVPEGDLVFYTNTLLVALACTDNAGGSGCATGGTFYTIDGTTPTILSNVYTGPIAVSRNTTVKYFSVDNVGNEEQIKQEAYVKGDSGVGATHPLFLLLGLAGLLLRRYDARIHRHR